MTDEPLNKIMRSLRVRLKKLNREIDVTEAIMDAFEDHISGHTGARSIAATKENCPNSPPWR